MQEHFERLDKCGMPSARSIETLQDVRVGRGAAEARASSCKAVSIGILRGKDFTEDETVLEAANQVMQGNCPLHWYNAKTERI